MFAPQGYWVIAVNPTGSTGYGQGAPLYAYIAVLGSSRLTGDMRKTLRVRSGGLGREAICGFEKRVGVRVEALSGRETRR